MTISKIIIVPNNKHILQLYSIWDSIISETYWQGYRQVEIPCNKEKTANNPDSFVDYYMEKIQKHDWSRGPFRVTLNFRDLWGAVHKTREWIFEE